MKNDKVLVSKCFHLLERVFHDSFHLPVLLFTPPYRDISDIDLGLRASVWPDYFTAETDIMLSDAARPYRILLIKSNLGFYNVLVSFSADATPDFLSIGPFRKEELSSAYYIRILKEANVPPASLQAMKHLYGQMPTVSPDTVLKMTKDMLSAFIPEFSSVTPEHYAFADRQRSVSVNLDLLEKNLLASSEQFSHFLLRLLHIVQTGQTENVEAALWDFLEQAKLLHYHSLREGKMLLLLLNNYCHLALLETTVHPSHALKLAFTIASEIEKSTDTATHIDFSHSICMRYCQLAKTFNFPQYSSLTRNVIAYIHSHMDEDLSLYQLAKYFGKAPSVLSSRFHKDTGETLIRFIQKLRIKEAVYLLHYSDLSISDIAITVGYQDFSYFSKVFSREMGCCPREYRKQKK